MSLSRSAFSVVGLAATLVVLASGCSDTKSADSSEKTGATSSAPSTTTIAVTLNSEPVDLTGATLKCYDFEGHLSVEAYNAADREATNFLMDYYNNGVSLSIHIRGGNPDLYEYDQGKAAQTATVTRNGNLVSVTGKIGVALDDTTEPKPFSITANCAKFFATAPDSSSL